MPLLIILLSLVCIFVVLHLGPLGPDDVLALAHKRRRHKIKSFYTWARNETAVDRDFKSSMNKNGALHSVSEPLSSTPSLVAALLKGKKHEWIVYALAKDDVVQLIYYNKGPDRTSVAPAISAATLVGLAQRENSQTVLCFHNHPNAVMLPSEQDLYSARALGDTLEYSGLALIEFVCGRGHFVEYYRAIPDELFPVDQFCQQVRDENGTGPLRNLRLHLERYF
ncbi:MAG TPA: Mov34/MPN/PAD-1 family protein [Bryobacteraceae bacterium]|nr:hypothetical protein [Bryobacterales bacterium]HRJ20878.1 Mov34/MPN/PAD-1 family protein [Bryobacteraceae bacterium]